MANKHSFTPDEWTKVLETTMLAGMAITAAEPSGLWGLMSVLKGQSVASATSATSLGKLVEQQEHQFLSHLMNVSGMNVTWPLRLL